MLLLPACNPLSVTESGPLRTFSIRFLIRPECHLCDDARPVVQWAAKREKAGLEEIDIDTDDRLLAIYGLRIPVVLGPSDEVLAEGVIDDRKALRRAMRAIRVD